MGSEEEHDTGMTDDKNMSAGLCDQISVIQSIHMYSMNK